MPAKDIFHDTVKQALVNDDWRITHEHYWVKLPDSDMHIYVDLAAEPIIGAEKDDQKIAVEIKSFLGNSWMTDFHEALGQFLDYRIALREKEPERQLYLAVPLDIYNAFFSRRFIQTVCTEYQVKLLVFDPSIGEVYTWIK
jgi:hypothetical protein